MVLHCWIVAQSVKTLSIHADKYCMARRKTQPQSYNSSRSSTRVNGNYKVNLTFDDLNHRGTVTLEQDWDSTPQDPRGVEIKYTVPNLRQNQN